MRTNARTPTKIVEEARQHSKMGLLYLYLRFTTSRATCQM